MKNYYVFGEGHIALKEWHSIIKLLGEGKVTVILRKGGIHEKNGFFEPEHKEFFLFPTWEHQKVDFVKDEFRDVVLKSMEEEPKDDKVFIKYWAYVETIAKLESEEEIGKIEKFHPLNYVGALERFRYKKPFLYALLLRVFEMEDGFYVPRSKFALCSSWVDFEEYFNMERSKPVIDDKKFDKILKEFVERVMT